MTAVTYTAKRGVINTHTAGDEYSLNLQAVAVDESREVGAETQSSLSNRTETLWYHGTDQWSVRVVVQGASALAALKEFLQSTEGGESFEFDAYGTVAAPDDPITAQRVQTGYSLERITNLYTTDDAFEVGFTVRAA